MEKSESIKEIGKALMTFQQKVDKIKKDASNPFFKSKYATLSNILDTVQLPLIESGLSFAQLPDGEHNLTTLLMHPASGEFLQASYNMTPVKNDPQAVGSAITYARRYALGAILGLNIDEDDDGNKASGKKQETKTEKEQEKPWLNPKSPAWQKAVEFLKGEGTMEQIKKKYLISKTNEEQLKNEVL